MKKIFLIIMLLTSAICYGQVIHIGKATLRFDSDSNKIKISRNNTLPARLATEFDLQLFDFNPAEFSWSASTGLNLIPGLGQDSIFTQKLNIFADTGDGEILPYKSRSYTLKKPNWWQVDMYDLKYFYESKVSGVLDESAELWAINYSTVIDYDNDPLLLTGAYANLSTFSFTRSGQWQITVEYEYLFEFGVNAGADNYNQIDIHVIAFPATELNLNTYKVPYPAGLYGGFQGAGSFICVIDVSSESDQFILQAMRTANIATLDHNYINKFKITAILLH